MSQPHQTQCFKEAVVRVQHLFVETRGVTLTTADAARIAGLDRQVCRAVLRTLIETGFLSSGRGACSSAARRLRTNCDHGGLRW